MTDTSRCPRCGSVLSADLDVNRDVCPRCLLAAGLDPHAVQDPLARPADGPEPVAETSVHETDPASASGRAMCDFGDYTLLEEIGRGGMGIVYRAWQKNLKRVVALKILLAGRWASTEQVRRFRAEAEAAAALNHPNIVPIHEIGEHEGQPYFSMKWIEGRSLARIGRRLAFREAATLLARITRAVQHAHEHRVLHRDLKPNNVVVDRHGEPHLTDFGLAKRLEAPADLTHSETVLGTPCYMAPEQAAGLNQALGPTTDVYSLGAMFFELLTGRPPFLGQTLAEIVQKVRDSDPPSPRALDATIPRDLATICLKCLSRSPARRYATAAELLEDLERWLDGRPIGARPVTWREKAWLWARRNPWPTLAGILLLLLATGSTLAAWRLHRIGERARRAELESGEKLWTNYLVQARAHRLSGQAGRRPESLAAAAAAAAMRPSRPLRNEAIAALAQLDLGPPQPWLPAPPNGGPSFAHLSPDFETGVLVRQRRELTVRRLRDGADLHHFTIPGGQVFDVRFSPDARHLLAACHNGRLLLWDLRRPDPSPRTNFPAVQGYFQPAAFDPTATRLAVATADQRIQVFDLPTGTELGTLDIGVVPYRFAFDPGAEFLAVMEGARVQVWHVAQGRRLQAFTHSLPATLLAWHPAGRQLAVGYENGDLRLCDTETGASRPLPGHTQYIWRLAFDPQGQFLVSQAWDSTLRFWEPGGGQALFSLPHGDTFQISEDGTRFALWEADGAIRLRQILRSDVFRAITSPTASLPHLTGAEVSPDGRWLVFGTDAGWHLWDLSLHREVVMVPAPHVRWPKFHPDGQTVIALTDDAVQRWALTFDGPPGLPPRVGPAHDLVTLPGSEFQRAAFSANGDRLALAGHGRSLVLDWADPSRQVPFARGRRQSHVALSADDRWVAAAAFGGMGATVWDARSGQLARHLVTNDNAQVAFSRDSRLLVTATPRECVLWEVPTWRPRHRWSLGLSGGVPVPAAFSPDGRLLALAATRTDVRLLDCLTGEEWATLIPPVACNLEFLAFSRDGRLLLGHTLARAVQVWDLHAARAALAGLGLGE